MAIKDFKKIEDRKGYLVDDDDRQIFEKEIGKAPFGMGLSDMIEFILYDASDNQLPQGERGELVRYIYLNDKESKKYYTITNTASSKKTNDASEIIFDLEELIKDAGYGTGVFKTQVTLLNRRAGTEEVQNDKLWIQEISPSRTEVRVLPIKNTDNPSKDLLRRYEIFTKEGNFRDDTIYYAEQYIQGMDINKIFQTFLREKGRLVDGIKYETLIKKEFKIGNLTEFFTKIKEKLEESVRNFIRGNYYLISDNRFGKPRDLNDILELSISDIDRTIDESLQDIIEYYLPKRNILEKTELTPEQQRTLDEVKNILKTSIKNDLYESTIPDTINLPIRGCTDPDAKNFNPSAEEDDGSCQYIVDPPIDTNIYGCTDKTALNYNPVATIDNNSCRYEKIEGGGTGTGGGGIDTVLPKIVGPKNYYVWSTRGSITYLPKDSTTVRILNGVEYDSFPSIEFVKDNIKFEGDIREVPKIKPPLVIRAYKVKNLMSVNFMFAYKDKTGKNTQSSTLSPNETIVVCAVKDSIKAPTTITGEYRLKILDVGTCPYTPPPIKGCTDRKATNYNPKAEVNDNSCIYPPDDIEGCTDKNALNYNPLATKDNRSCKYPPPISGCTDPRAKTYNPLATRSVPNDCVYDVPGCMNPKAKNFNPNATIDDGSCLPIITKISGCTDRAALNFNPNATHDNGSCRYKKPKVGCTDRNATNYDPQAEINSGCVYPIIRGCKDIYALNFNPNATVADKSLCRYEIIDLPGCTDPKALNYNGDATKDNGTCRYPSPPPPPSGGGGSGGGSGGTTGGGYGDLGEFGNPNNKPKFGDSSTDGSYVDRPAPKDAMK